MTMKSCFVSAPWDADTSALAVVLRENGFEVRLQSDALLAGQTIVEGLDQAIGKADLFIAIVNNRTNNSGVLFETGYAMARKKKVLVLRDSNTDLSSVFSALPVLTAKLADEENLRFLIGSYLEATSTKRSSRKELQSTKPIEKKAKELRQKIREAGSKATEAELLSILSQALRDSGVEVLSQPSSKDRQYDLAIWLDEIDSLIGNPVLIEVKRSLSSQMAKQLSRRFMSESNAARGRVLLVVYLEGPSELTHEEDLFFPLVLFISVDRLLEELEHRALGDYIRMRRNQLAHGSR